VLLKNAIARNIALRWSLCVDPNSIAINIFAINICAIKMSLLCSLCVAKNAIARNICAINISAIIMSLRWSLCVDLNSIAMNISLLRCRSDGAGCVDLNSIAIKIEQGYSLNFQTTFNCYFIFIITPSSSAKLNSLVAGVTTKSISSIGIAPNNGSSLPGISNAFVVQYLSL
jgi:hypothetical protein